MENYNSWARGPWQSDVINRITARQIPATISIRTENDDKKPGLDVIIMAQYYLWFEFYFPLVLAV